ncbi:hypothetical protein IMX26_05805 [Clostridium sp. 'deep sea']|uniref:hypothetical protein n=1 Tax=Clostridium sp. 'deep sea' TaxID=2779445 RepID=UPI0018966990|nr:hypothetical protein [Clostridium sp. 'deep sea']QOR36326.1 hypothetical protein IMX26_05805 [Clostridium sp. 'deep sea']
MSSYEYSSELEREVNKCWRSLGHEYINYLHDISLRIQLGKNPNEIISYIEELSSSLKHVRRLASTFSIIYNLKVQSMFLRLISAGFRMSYNDENSKEDFLPKNIDRVEEIVELLIENSTLIACDDKFIDLEQGENGTLKLCFLYAPKDSLLNIFKNQNNIIINEDEVSQQITLII